MRTSYLISWRKSETNKKASTILVVSHEVIDLIADGFIAKLKFSATMSLFSQPEFPEKEGGLPKLYWSIDVAGSVNIIHVFFLEVQAERTDSGFPKTF